MGFLIAVSRWGILLGLVWAAVSVWLAVKRGSKELPRGLWEGMTFVIGGLVAWPVMAAALAKVGMGYLWARALTAGPAYLLAFAIQDAITASAASNARRDAIQRATTWIAFVGIQVALASGLAPKFATTTAAVLTVETATHVRGVVRDQEFLEARVKLGQLPVGTPTGPGAVWQPARFVSAQHPALTTADLHDLRAGYTLELAGTEVPKGTTGWLSLKSQLAPEAIEALKGVMARQAIGDSEKWPGHFVDPISGETLPLRLYQRGDGKWVRVAGALVMCGPKGEKVIDLALRWDDKALFDDVSKHAIGLGGWFNPPYTGKKAPAKGGLGIF